MGWLSPACPRCWDRHDGQTCAEYQRDRARGHVAAETNRLLREQNELLARIADQKRPPYKRAPR